MPFDRKTPELDAVAGKVVLEFVRHEHPERFEGFLKDTGKTEDEWNKTVSISHHEFLILQGLVYGIWGKVDPWKFVEVGRYITKTDNPAVSTAKKLGSTVAVVTLSGMKSNPKLNIDSEIRPLTVNVEEIDGKRIGRALIAHDNLGFVDEKYLTAPTTSAGYLSGIPTLWGFNPMDVQVRMVDQGLEDIIQNEFTGVRINFTIDDKGNWLDNLGRTIAGRISLNETPYTNVPNKHKTYRIKESNKLFVGDPGRFLRLKKEDYEEVDYSSYPMHKTYEDIFGIDKNGNQILVAKGGTYFGGPFSVYELEWEERPLNWISKLVVNITEWWRSGTSRDVMHEIARKETLENALKEKELEETNKQLDLYLLEIVEKTNTEQRLIVEAENKKQEVRGHLHDIAHRFLGLRRQSYLGLANVVWGTLEESKRQAIFDEVGIINLPDSYEEFIRRVEEGLNETGKEDCISLVDVRNLSELVQETVSEEQKSLLESYIQLNQRLKDGCSEGDVYARDVMISWDPRPYEKIALDQMLSETLYEIRKKQARIGKNMNLELNTQECFVEGDQRMMTLLFENLWANAIKANRGVQASYVVGDLRIENGQVIFDIKNSVKWESLDEMEQVVAHANGTSNQRFSTDNPKGGLGLVYIKDTVRRHAGIYSANADFDKGEFLQTISLPLYK